MQPTSFKQTNKVYTSGDNPNTDQLPVAVCLNTEQTGGEEIPLVVSCWKLSEQEIANIQRTGVMWIACMGGQPPIRPIAEDPFVYHGYTPINIVDNPEDGNN